MNESSGQRPPYINDAEGIGFALWNWGITPTSKWDIAWAIFWLRGLIGILGLTWGVAQLAFAFEEHLNGLELLFVLSLAGFGGWLSYMTLDLDLRATQQYRGLHNAFIAARLAHYWDKPSQYPGGLRKMQRDMRRIEEVYSPDD